MIETSHLERRFQVFVSSTFKDLAEERDELSVALNLNNYIVEGMELFPAADVDQWEIIKGRMLESDLYVVVIADRYGSIAHTANELEPGLVGVDEAISYTHLEYRLAKSLHLPILAFVKELDRTDKLVDKFVDELQTGRMITFWRSTTELVAKVLGAINKKVKSPDFKNKGWIRAESIKKPNYADEASVYAQSKMQYVKLVSYSDRRTATAPLYSKTIARNNSVIEVWDEYVTISINQMSHLIDGFHYYMRTNGDGVDFSSLLPFVNKFKPTDYGAGMKDTIYNPEVPLPSDTYVHACSYYNGFQKGNMDMSTMASKYALVMRLIVDFTSIPEFDKKFKMLRCVQVSSDENGEEDITKYAKEFQAGIFGIEREKVAKGTVLKFEFDLLQ